ncbi:YciI family protein [Psychroflexus aestuariivivens]|uniref:YciI family protein n=1 Tax=Psychroflexus aestuariivivens TaxID=1795040 RepID=UPI000FD6E9A0|nr:YciI family protein [Psychroflexus aestuariivivens]
MKSKIIFPFIILIFNISCQKNDQVEKNQLENKRQLVIDSLTKSELNADDYGMKTYVIAFLKSGQNDSLDSTEISKLQQAHLKNIRQLADDGKMVLAGPFLNDSNFRGLFIFNTASIDSAKTYTESDPAIQAGLFSVEYKKWYGSGALPLVNKLGQQLETKSFSE